MCIVSEKNIHWCWETFIRTDKSRTDGRTDRRTNGNTDGRTEPKSLSPKKIWWGIIISRHKQHYCMVMITCIEVFCRYFYMVSFINNIKGALYTLKQWANPIPCSYTSNRHVLSKGNFQKEHGYTTNDHTYEVRKQECPWKKHKTRILQLDFQLGLIRLHLYIM